MACFTVAELSFCREKLGLEVVGEGDLAQMVAAFMSAAKAVHATRAASDAAKKEAEIQGELEAQDEESKAKLAAQATLLASSREQAEATAAAKQAEREAAPVPAMVDWPMFVTV